MKKLFNFGGGSHVFGKHTFAFKNLEFVSAVKTNSEKDSYYITIATAIESYSQSFKNKKKAKLFRKQLIKDWKKAI